MTAERPLRIAFLTPWNVDDARSWSGIVQPMLRALSANADVVAISTHDVRPAVVDRALAKLTGKLTDRTYLWDFGLATSMKRSRCAARRIASADVDVVFAVAASVDVAFLPAGSPPVVQYVDATFESVRGLYPVFTSLSWLSAAQVRRVGARAARRTAAVVAASRWVLERLRAEGTRLPGVVAPPGAAISPHRVEDRLVGTPIRALLVSSDWNRKGGDRAVGAVAAARDAGVGIELTVVGDRPGGLPDWVDARGRLAAPDLSEEYSRADVLLEPARVNAAGVTLTDAAAHGLPAIASGTLGVPSIVAENLSGFLIDPDADVVHEAGELLIALGRGTRKLPARTQVRGWYDRELAWDVWAARVVDQCRRASLWSRTGRGSTMRREGAR